MIFYHRRIGIPFVRLSFVLIRLAGVIISSAITTMCLIQMFILRDFSGGDKGRLYFLIDEAHNMVERSRQMYSAQIYKEDFLTVKRIMKEHSRSIEKALEKCNKILLGMKRECENYTVYDTFGNMVFSFMRLMTLLDEFCRRLMSFRGKGCYGFLF